jgi:hypothetical protein
MMKKFEVEYYEVYESYDRDSTLIARFTNLADAQKLKSTSNYYNCSSTPTEKSFSVFESYQEYEDFKKDEPRRKALAKLTSKERQLLGLE